MSPSFSDLPGEIIRNVEWWRKTAATEDKT